MTDPKSYKSDPLRRPGLSEKDHFIYLTFKQVTDDFEFNHKDVKEGGDHHAVYWILKTDVISRLSIQDYFFKHFHGNWKLEGVPGSAERNNSITLLKSHAMQVFLYSIETHIKVRDSRARSQSPASDTSSSQDSDSSGSSSGSKGVLMMVSRSGNSNV